MRTSWRLLLLRSSHARSTIRISSRLSHFQVSSHPQPNLHPLGSFVKGLHSLVPPLGLSPNPPNNTKRCFCSEPALEPNDPDHAVPALEPKDPDHTVPALEPKDSAHAVVVSVFSRNISDQEIKTQLESNNVVITHELVLNTLRSLYTTPDVASKVFNWVLKNDGGRLSSKSYNLMLGILGVSGSVKEFWDLFDNMKKKGYGVSKGTFSKVLKKFEEDGRVRDVEILWGIHATGYIDRSEEKMCSLMCTMIRRDVWSDDVEQKLQGLNVTFTSHLVDMVLGKLALEPTKALMFFRWVEESGLFKHDEKTYNAMATVLGREDCIDRFWNVVGEIRSLGYEMEAATYRNVRVRFNKPKMIKEFVHLYEFAMGGANKPLVQDCTLILGRIVKAKDLDMDLFSRVLRAFFKGGNALPDSTIDAVLSSLKSAHGPGKSGKVLKTVEDGFLAIKALGSKIAFGLSSAGGKDTAELVHLQEETGGKLDCKMWTQLIKGYCVAGDLDKVSECFHMIEKEGSSCAVSAFDALVNAYCLKDQSLYAYQILTDQVTENQLKPWLNTYRALITNLLVHGNFSEALNLLGIMKRDGFPPFIGPFIEHVPKSGNADDAILFLKTMTRKTFPSKNVFLRVFDSFFNHGRHEEAQNFLSKCPGFIRNDADVLNLFFSAKSGKGDIIAGVAA